MNLGPENVNLACLVVPHLRRGFVRWDIYSNDILSLRDKFVVS